MTKLEEIVQRAKVAGHCDWLTSSALTEAAAAQSARIAELEAENARFERELGDALFVGKELQAERDAVRKALAWFVSPVTMMNGEVHFSSIIVRCHIPIPWTGEEKEAALLRLHEAALLAAAPEGGVK